MKLQTERAITVVKPMISNLVELERQDGQLVVEELAHGSLVVAMECGQLVAVVLAHEQHVAEELAIQWLLALGASSHVVAKVLEKELAIGLLAASNPCLAGVKHRPRRRRQRPGQQWSISGRHNHKKSHKSQVNHLHFQKHEKTPNHFVTTS